MNISAICNFTISPLDLQRLLLIPKHYDVREIILVYTFNVESTRTVIKFNKNIVQHHLLTKF